MTPIDRRSLLQRALLIAGASIAPGFNLEALAQASDAGDRLLDQKKFDLLSAVADTMVPRTDTPGAIDVGVPRAFDMLLRNWASPQRRQDLVGALEAINNLALARHKRPFAKLTAPDRLAVLSAHDAAALPLAGAAPARQIEPVRPAPTVGDPDYGRPRQEATQSPPAAAPDPAYAKLKELIVTLYYVSEPALTEELRYEHSPGEFIPSLPITPQSRPSGGLGAI